MSYKQYSGPLSLGQKIPLGNLEGAGLLTFGNIYYVSSTATGSSDSNTGRSKNSALSTIDAAIGKCTANQGDVILVLPGHAETVTAAITADVAGVSIIGLGEGNVRPSVTGNGTIDAITVTAANVTIANLRFPAPGTDDQTADVNVAAAGCTIRNTHHIGSTTSKNKTDIITVASGGDDLLVEGCLMYNTVVDCVSAISLEAAVARPVLRNLLIQGTFSTAAVMDEATATLVTLKDSLIKNIKAATAVLDFGTGNSTGMVSNCHISGRHTTLASNILEGTGMDFFETYLTEQAALNGVLHPDADAD